MQAAPVQISSRYRLFDRWALAALPAVILLVAVFLLPLLYMLKNSFYAHAGLGQVGTEFTFGNYVEFLTDSFYLEIMLDTLILGLSVVTCCLIMGFPVAYVLARAKTRFRGLLIFAVVSPLLISIVIRNLGWLPILSESGMVNWALMSLGLIDAPLALSNNFLGVVIGMVHATLPFMILTLTTVLIKIAPELEQAAAGLGAGPVRIFWQILWPLCRPGILGGYLVVFTITISAFTTPAMLGGRRVLVMPLYIAQQFQSVLNYAAGATAAAILLVTAIALTLVSLREGRKEAKS